MKIGFTGDLSFVNIDAYTDRPFRYVGKDLSQLNLVINLESVFLPTDYDCEPIKKKICLSHEESTVKHLKSLSPILINLSNNHINDYGNYGCENTYRVLKENSIRYFGAGYEYEQHNYFVLEKERILFLSYTLGTDRTSKKLYNEPELIGPRKYSLEQYKKDVSDFKEYTVIILFHWGAQPSRFPFPFQREIARELIDNGADIIIGNHAHVYQAYESYKDKWIFYALGNFLLPNFMAKFHGKLYKVYATPEKKHSIVPVFDISSDGAHLLEVLSLKANKTFELEFKGCNLKKYNPMLLDNAALYKIFHLFYLKYRRLKVQFDKVVIIFIKRIDKKVRKSIS